MTARATAICLLCCIAPVVTVLAQQEKIPIEADAEVLEYDRAAGWIYASGNVTIRKGGQVLKADKVRVNTNTEDAYAEGNVWFQSAPGTDAWTGEEAHYNFRTREGIITDLSGFSAPFTIDSAQSQMLADGSMAAEDVTITTCTNDVAFKHYCIRASKLTLVPDEYVACRHARFYAGAVPIFYLPYLKTDCDGGTGWHFQPGYSSDMGAFLLSSYRARLSPSVKSETHLDYRSERGFAVGQDFMWKDRDGIYDGMISGYFIDDDKPIEEDEDEGKDIENQRYRFHFDHAQSFGNRESLLVNGDYLSDVDLLEDFFEDEYRKIRQPDNYAVYTYRDDEYTTSLQARKRLNDFYEDVDRLPEGAITFQRQRLGQSDLYYEGRTSLGYLEKLYPEGSESDDYSAFRGDTLHRVLWPGKYAGFLNVIPRAGFRGTYYSDTRRKEDETVVELVEQETQTIDSDGNTNTITTTVLQTNSVTRTYNESADFRTLFEVGVDVSFKAFKLWEGGVVTPLRHIVEPYAKYTFIPEPSVTPENLYQFDDTDTLGEQHNVRLGVQNTWQTKRAGGAWQIADMDVWTWYRFTEEFGEDSDGIDDLYVDLDLTPNRWFRLDLDARFDTDESELSELNTRLRFVRKPWWRGELENRFRKDDSNLITTDLTMFPHRNWDVNVFGRYEAEDSRMEEVGGYLQRNLDCMKIRLGALHRPGYTTDSEFDREDEWRARVELWLTAFPDVRVSARYKQ